MPNETRTRRTKTSKPERKARKKGSIVRRIGPFAPLALALLMHNAVTKPPAAEPPASPELSVAICESVESFEDCHSRYPTGCSAEKPYDTYLNLLKNQLTPPPESVQGIAFLSADDFEARDAKTPDEISSKKRNHFQFKDQLAQLGEGQTLGLAGYLYAIKKTDKENSNCGLPDVDTEGSNVDYHMWIGFDEAIAERLRNKKATDKDLAGLKKSGIIVEMTPHYRARFHAETWKLSGLKDQIGKQVRVIGQLIFDSEHNIASQNCFKAKTAKEKDLCWRGSAWELHPVTQFLICSKASGTCATQSSDWIEVPATVP